MGVKLGYNQYGKAENRVVRVFRDSDPHEIVDYNVSVALNGRDHFYERVKPQQGIVYFVVGSGGQLRPGNLDSTSSLTAKGFDKDQAFMAAEIIGDELPDIA